MSDLVKLAYQPGEADADGDKTPRNPASNSMEESFNSTASTEYDTGSDETTESGDSGEEGSVKGESPYSIKKCPNKREKLNTDGDGTPGLSDGVIADAEGTLLNSDKSREGLSKPQKPTDTDKTTSQSSETRKSTKSDGAKDTKGSQGPDISQKTKSTKFSISEEDVEVKISDYKFINRVASIPMVRSALHVYDAAKDVPCVGMAIALSEIGANLALSPVMFFGAPLSNLCSAPINCVDSTLCLCLDVAETVFPCLKMTPGQIVGATTNCAMNTVCCFPRTVAGVCNICGGSGIKEEKTN